MLNIHDGKNMLNIGDSVKYLKISSGKGKIWKTEGIFNY